MTDRIAAVLAAAVFWWVVRACRLDDALVVLASVACAIFCILMALVGDDWPRIRPGG